MPTADVSWFKNGVPVVVDNKLQVLVDTDKQLYTLLVTESTADDAAEYAVTAVNAAGKVYNAITVMVEEAKDDVDRFVIDTFN